VLIVAELIAAELIAASTLPVQRCALLLHYQARTMPMKVQTTDNPQSICRSFPATDAQLQISPLGTEQTSGFITAVIHLAGHSGCSLSINLVRRRAWQP
jgi:hypothetical protein